MAGSAELIRRARLAAGLTQRQLAERADKAVSVIGRWERGEVLPSLETVIDLISAAGLRLQVGIVDELEHDRGLIAESLALTPQQRLVRVTKLANMVLAGRERMGGTLRA
ncbi:MAG: helix-turn-helix transcriptional regulator [Acidimicrobiia bacterium]|nr:helix-turn-helix transcriptional regulator [Acidimicrobiia bacterium]